MLITLQLRWQVKLDARWKKFKIDKFGNNAQVNTNRSPKH